MWNWDHPREPDKEGRVILLWLQHQVVTVTEASRQLQPKSASSDPRESTVACRTQDRQTLRISLSQLGTDGHSLPRSL